MRTSRLFASVAFVAAASAAAQSPAAGEIEAIYELGQCVAASQPDEAMRVLGQDDASRQKAAFRSLITNSQELCGGGSSLPSLDPVSERTLAGAIAEALLISRVGAALEPRLAGSKQTRLRGRDREEKTDLCLIHSSPKQVLVLLRTKPGSSDEQAAARIVLDGAYGACAVESGFPKSFVDALEPSAISLRTGLSLAALRLIAANEESPNA